MEQNASWKSEADKYMWLIDYKSDFYKYSWNKRKHIMFINLLIADKDTDEFSKRYRRVYFTGKRLSPHI